MKLLTTNAKLEKSVDGYTLLGLQLAPHTLSGRNVCPHASPGCAAACLFSAGNGGFPSVRKARIEKTRFFHENRAEFLSQLIGEIEKERNKASREDRILAIRLNTLSDIPWENVKIGGKNVMELFPDVTFYDYTKSVRRALAFAKGEMPVNYHLTFSRSETNEAQAKLVAAAGGNVAAVFRLAKGKELPKTFWNRPVVDGDKSDARFLDPKGVIVGLKAKNKGNTDTSGFVINL